MTHICDKKPIKYTNIDIDVDEEDLSMSLVIKTADPFFGESLDISFCPFCGYKPKEE